MAIYRLSTSLGSLATATLGRKAGIRAASVPLARVGLTPFVRKASAKAYTEVPSYLKERMRVFQAPNDLPVHIKGGLVDKILYGITSLVCLIGVVDCCRVYYRLSYPEIKK